MSELYRVRDRNDPKRGPGKVWGENLTHAEAHKLKETVCGQRKSTTARIEPMSVPAVATAQPPIANDPVITDIRTKATAAAAGAAQAAQRRAEAFQAKQKIEKVIQIPPIEVPEFDESDLGEVEVSNYDVNDLLEEIPSVTPVRDSYDDSEVT